jgi:hypothetical protein
MTCVMFKHGDTELGVTVATQECGGLTLVLDRVPAHVYVNCGERMYVGDVTASRLLGEAEALAKPGAVVDVRENAGA